MEMNDAHRADLARRVKEVRLGRYKGSRLAAYSDVGVNSATWSRIEAAQTVKEGSLVRVIQGLWPETGGDWEQMSPPLEGPRIPDDVLDEINKLGPETRAFILRELGLEPTESESTEAGESA